MCDPVTAVIGALTGGAALLGGSKKKDPPPPAMAQAQPVNTAAATPSVKVGPEDNDPSKAAFKAATGMTTQRKAGTPLGGLGKSSMDLGL
jgi:hypothetical protein